MLTLWDGWASSLLCNPRGSEPSPYAAYMRFRLQPPGHALRVLSLLALCGLCACGEGGDARAFVPGEATREGIAVNLAGIDYEVFITRELNIFDPEDQQYYEGPPAPPGTGYYGVFLRACALEDVEGPVRTSTDVRVVDIRGQVYRPLPLEPDNDWAYRGEVLDPGECLPNQASATSYGPTGGAMLLFRIPHDATENRPFVLEIGAPAARSPERRAVRGAPSASPPERRVARFELDL